MKIHNKNIRVSLGVVGFVFLVMTAIAGFYFYAVKNGVWFKVSQPSVLVTDNIDENNTPSQPVDVSDLILATIADENGVSPDRVAVKIEKNDAKFAKGTYTIDGGETLPFLSVNVNGDTWVNADMGSSDAPLCADTREYSIPVSYAPTCFDDDTATTIDRK